MFCSPLRTAALVGCLLSIAGCSRQPTLTRGQGRIAVLRFENLTDDPSLDWMGRAASEIIAREISSGPLSVLPYSSLRGNPVAQFHPVSAPGESSERDAAILEGATRIVIGQITLVRKQLTLDVTERDSATGKTLQAFTLSAPNAGDLYTLADSAARRFSSKITSFESHNDAAIAAWVRAAETTDYNQAIAEYSNAVHADPGFADAWIGWAAALSAHGDRAAAAKVLSDAQQQPAKFSEVNRTRLKVAAGEISGDRAATLAALNELSRLQPEDVNHLRTTADRNFAARHFPEAIAGYRKLAQLTPANEQTWNQLGYALLYSGDYDGAMSALREYQKLAPRDPNPLDSQGDVAFAFGRFGEAEKLYDQSTALNRTFQNAADSYKAAEAHLLTGDVAGANRKFEAWAALRRAAKDPIVPFRSAQWLFYSGKHEEARAALAKLLASDDPQYKAAQLRSLAFSQLAIWDLQSGARDRALQEANEGLKGGGATPTTLVVRLAAENAHGAAEWSARVDRVLAAPQLAQLKPAALAYALYFAGEWQAAEPLWKAMLERATPDDAITPAVYGQILVELKREKEAERYVRLFPLPHPGEPDEFRSLVIPRVLATRSVVFAAEGKTADAEGARKLFVSLWGAK